MDTVRLFIAISLPAAIKASLAELQKNLQVGGAQVKWVERENFHLTLKFLGATPQAKCPGIIQAMEEVAENYNPFELRITGLGTFPARGRPKVVWAGLGGNKGQLVSLQASLEQKLATFGFPPEQRQYTPHLTLGRIKEFANLGDLPDRINLLKNQGSAPWQVNAMELMQSTLTPAGPLYQVLGRVPFPDTRSNR